MTGDRSKAAKSLELAPTYAVLQHLVVPTFVIDAQRRVVVWNRACERLTGVTAAEVLGTSKHWQAFYEKRRYCLADLVALGRQDRIGELYTEYVATRDESLGSSAENWCVMPRLGNHLYLAIDAGPILDDDGKLIAVVETLRDMTDQKRAEMALQTLAAKDALTGLANRRSFDQALELEWSRAMRSGRTMALLFADVDHFKRFNDCHGHQGGDECLRDSGGGDRQERHPADRPCRPLRRRGVRHHHARHRYGGRAESRRTAAHVGAGPEDRARRFRRWTLRDDEHRRCHLHARPGRDRSRLAARPGRPGALCCKTSRPKPRHLLRYHADGARARAFRADAGRQGASRESDAGREKYRARGQAIVFARASARPYRARKTFPIFSLPSLNGRVLPCNQSPSS